MTNKDDIINMMATHEETISQLYQIYSTKFEFYQQFWLDLSIEETEHAVALHNLNKQVNEGKALYNERLFRAPAIQTSLNYMEERIREARMKNISMLNAISISLDIEKSMLENGFFEVFKGDSIELVKTFNYLEEATKFHIARVQDLWENQGKLEI